METPFVFRSLSETSNVTCTLLWISVTGNPLDVLPPPLMLDIAAFSGGSCEMKGDRKMVLMVFNGI